MGSSWQTEFLLTCAPQPIAQRRNKMNNTDRAALGSSERTPSDHSSVFDAETFQHGEQPFNEYELPDRGAGTRLCTITERNSIQTLKTLPSVRTFQGRITSVEQSQLLPDIVGTANLRRRRCFSVDDIAKRVVGSSADLPEVPKKAQPPQKPPCRKATPPGFPRWPGDIDCSSERRERRRRSHYLTGLRWLRSNVISSRTGLETSLRRGRRYWRPPVSGHSTHRFADLSSHPFVAASDIDTLSPARQALRSVGEFTVPVTPSRATAKAAQRSAPLPANVRSHALAHRRLSMSLYSSHHIDQPARHQILNLCRRKLARVQVTRVNPSPRSVSHEVHSLDGAEPTIRPCHTALQPMDNQNQTSTGSGSALAGTNARTRTRSLPHLERHRPRTILHRMSAESRAVALQPTPDDHRPVMAHARTTPVQMPSNVNVLGCRA
ncbi:hypothetical protein CERZMDRAFT_83335 [Cercospora zeae-maydis SCOH1-5]|uniref:Uncharacterized protein n=1 Tax=Cercospora zeae-maydis SCOH1-5 TaxID=717836 RepID=A0A6A6FKB3_9PEZI|nr:hypothetical protein CERZMDRAFT_83335 [Cercospora zeae-maydis SCOH1-5]